MTSRRDRHPPTLETHVRRAIAEHALFARGDVVLCAVSGGPDSMALLHVLARLRADLGHCLVACGVDHGLRPEARTELALAEGLAHDLDVPMEVVTTQVPPGGNLQARARTARHALLREVAHRVGAAVVATGHTADDRAETVLLRLLRGAGPRGLAVLPPKDGRLVRPLIRARRRDILAHVARHAIVVAVDPSNADARFARVRVRNEVLPLLTSMAPRVVDALNHLADALQPLRDAPDPLAHLGRDQRRAVERALRLGRTTARVRIAGGRDLLATRVAGGAPLPASGEGADDESNRHAFPGGQTVLMSEDVAPPGHRRDRRTR